MKQLYIHLARGTSDPLPVLFEIASTPKACKEKAALFTQICTWRPHHYHVTSLASICKYVSIDTLMSMKQAYSRYDQILCSLYAIV